MNSVVYRSGSQQEHYDVSIVIPLFNRVGFTRQCWNAIVDTASTSLRCEVVFVDNASTDDTPVFLETLFAFGIPVAVIKNVENLGFAKACNQGAKASRGGIVVFLNNDTIVHDGWLPPLVDELIVHEKTGVVGGRLLYPDGSIQHAGVGISRKHIPYHLYHRVKFDDPLVVLRRVFRIVTGACLAVRKSDFLAIGGFDEGYRNGHEDVDLCLRYDEAGQEIVYRPDCVVTHFESQSENRFSHCRANTERTLLRWYNKLAQDDFRYGFVESSRAVAKQELSIAFKIPASDRAAEPNATIRMVEELAAEFSRRGHLCHIHYADEWGLDDKDKDVVVVVLGENVYIPKPYSPTVLLLTDRDALVYIESIDVALYDRIVCQPGLCQEASSNIVGAYELALDTTKDDFSFNDCDSFEDTLISLANSQKIPTPSACPKKKTSILMATYNRRELLLQAIESIRNQTIQSWELIIVNDGGESVEDVVTDFRDERIIYRDVEHCSKGQAINTAFSLCSGDYIAYCDDDDIWYPDHLERALFFLQSLPGIEMTYSDLVETTLNIGADGSSEIVRRRPLPTSQISFADLLECNCIPGITVVHARELFEQVGGMDPSLEVLVDFDMWRRLAMRTTPYHISALTAERYFRRYIDMSSHQQITNLAISNRRRYLANLCRILRKPLLDSIPEKLHKEQCAVRKKVQALFVNAQGEHYSNQGNHKRAASCFRLAGKFALQLSRELMQDLYHA